MTTISVIRSQEVKKFFLFENLSRLYLKILVVWNRIVVVTTFARSFPRWTIINTYSRHVERIRVDLVGLGHEEHVWEVVVFVSLLVHSIYRGFEGTLDSIVGIEQPS